MVDFENELYKIIDERISVLSGIERIVFTDVYGLSEFHKEIMSVQTISMIYSIWEGFINISFKMYIEYLNDKNIVFSNFHENIIAYDMQAKFKQFNESPTKDKSKFLKFYNEFSNYSNQTNKNISAKFNTESNVGLSVLNKLLESFNIEIFPEQWEEYKHPKVSLKDKLTTFLRYRNSVAHGGDITSEEKVTQEVFVGYKQMIIDLMYEIANKMNHNLNNNNFLR